MSTEVKRDSFGMTDKGAVVVIQFNNTGPNNEDNFFYQVRHGVRTVAEFPSLSKAETLAKALTA